MKIRNILLGLALTCTHLFASEGYGVKTPEYNFEIENHSHYDVKDVSVVAKLSCFYPSGIGFSGPRSCGEEKELIVINVGVGKIRIEATDYLVNKRIHAKYVVVDLTVSIKSHQRTVTFWLKDLRSQMNTILLNAPELATLSIKVQGLPLKDWLINKGYEKASIHYNYGTPYYNNYPTSYYVGSKTGTSSLASGEVSDNIVTLSFSGFAFELNKKFSELYNVSRLYLSAGPEVYEARFETNLELIQEVNFINQTCNTCRND